MDLTRSGRFHWQAVVNATMHIRIPQDVASQEGLWFSPLAGVREKVKVKAALRAFVQVYCTLAPRNFLPSPLQALCISQTHSAKEGTNGIWPAISQFSKRAGFFYMPQSWDMGQIILLPLRRKAFGFGRERTGDLGYQRPACQPLDHRSRLVWGKQLAAAFHLRNAACTYKPNIPFSIKQMDTYCQEIILSANSL
jgi:hypothetical protein